MILLPQRQDLLADGGIKSTVLAKLLLSIFVAGLLGTDGAVIARAEQGDPLQDRMIFVGKLLNDSSAAQQVNDSDVEAARELRGRAVEQYEAALQAHKSGEFKAAEAGLSEAIKLMYAAVSAVRKNQAPTEKNNRDFKNRQASVDALLAAHERISGEKGRRKEHELLRKEIAAEVGRATELLQTGEPEEAWHYLNSAYKMIKAAVKELREGDTLVRELKFETKEDEYIYELDRNDTHVMLIEVLLKDRLEDERIRDRVKLLTSKAEELRAVAESQAMDGQFAKAIETLEQSTSQLVKAIRGAGVYIPG